MRAVTQLHSALLDQLEVGFVDEASRRQRLFGSGPTIGAARWLAARRTPAGEGPRGCRGRGRIEASQSSNPLPMAPWTPSAGRWVPAKVIRTGAGRYLRLAAP